MQDTHAEITTSKRTGSASNDGNRLARALGSSRVRQQATSDDSAVANTIPSWMTGSGGGTTIRLLQKNSKGKASVRALVVPEDARFAQQSTVNEDTAKEEAEMAMKNKLFILEQQLAEEEGEEAGSVPILMNTKPLLPGQQAQSAKQMTHSQVRKESRKINSRAIGLTNAHLSQFESDSERRQGGGLRFARRGFGGNRN